MRPILTLFFFTVWLTACQHKTTRPDDNKQLTYEGDTVIYLSKTDNKIELLKPNYPKLEYFTEQESKGRYLDAVYVKDNNEKPIILKDGELIVYNRFYEMEDKVIFNDSLITVKEYYYQGKLSSRELNYYKDSIFVTTHFYDKGNPRTRKIVKPNNETESCLWYKNGTLQTHSIRKKLIEICDFWTEEGYFDHRERYTYPDVENDKTISQEIIDRENQLVKKIQ